MILSFDEWLATGQRTPRNKWTFRQYGDYLEGWHQSMPWSYKEMSLSYYDWAESRWNQYPCKESLKTSWKHGMALCAKAWTDGVYEEWKHKPIEEAADLMLITFYGKPKQLTENNSWINILKNRLGNLWAKSSMAMPIEKKNLKSIARGVGCMNAAIIKVQKISTAGAEKE